MSQSHSNTAFRNTRRQVKDLSAPHLRALRKELLMVRADVERVELAQATVDLRQAVAHFSWLKFIVPGFGGLRMSSGSKTGFLNAGTIRALLKQYPLVSSIASILLAKPLRATVLASAKPVLKWGSLALAGWEAYRIWQQIKSDPNKSTGGKAEPADSGS